MLSLKSFHVFFISTSIVLTAGFGVWGAFNGYVLLGTLSFGVAIILVAYATYFLWMSDNIHLQ